MPLANFDNQFIRELPADPIIENGCRSVEFSAYSLVTPKKTQAPSLIAYNEQLVEQLGLTKLLSNQDAFTQVMTGNKLLAGMQGYALCYGGHQFGQWAGQLGDGRAINLGELVTKKLGYQTLQLKGAGKTPYSRRGDGCAVLRSSIREYLCSEALFNLGIPTTRALSLCLTGEKVLRDMMYNGNSAMESGAIVCRVSPSFLRFGNFELPSARGDHALLQQLVEYSIKADFPTLQADNASDKDVYIAWFKEICQRHCHLIIHWMRVGFVHGVMNTDNMSIIGETIDYGPYGWIDNFDLDWTPNSSDFEQKRYRFGQQSAICLWNLYRLANAILPLIGETAPLQAILNDYEVNYQRKWCQMMANKLGLVAYQGEDDLQLFKDLETLLSLIETDMTIFYRNLAKLSAQIDLTDMNSWLELFSPCFYDSHKVDGHYVPILQQWLTRYIARIELDGLTDSQRAMSMNKYNPKYVLRNYITQQAIELAELGDFSEIDKLQKIFTRPYDEQPQYEQYAKRRPEWAKNKIGCSTLSCSS
ncbi:protein adenylyltransferase SelO [Psychromonas sp. MME2]|uniref:protein adenylyltransferase SelO n=1 Tax=unclassified Psychromonas TaxID=2614957 RepID=UPI00339BBEC9